MEKIDWAKAPYCVTETTATRQIIVKGRDRWALDRLMARGALGCTPIDNPAPRWSAYVHNLRRKHGVNIETITEAHGGPFQGHHARYVLRSAVTLGAAPSADLGASE